MPLSREQAQALTRTVHLLRPAWSEEGIYAALVKCHQLEAHEVALAAIRAAADKTAKTPGVIPSRGSHWNEPDPGPRREPKLTREQRRARTCAECGALDGCRPPAHEFIPLDQAARNRNPHGIAAVRAALIAERNRVMDMEPAGSLAAERQSEVIADLSQRIEAASTPADHQENANE